MHCSPRLLLSAALLFALVAFEADADGVIEINAVQAAAGGLRGDLGADPPGYPVVIDRPGSYRLTGSLLSSQATLIVIRANQVTLDLAGFDLQGGSNQFDCILVDDPGFPRTAIAIHDGTIRGCRSGIDAAAADRTRFERLSISGAFQDGLRAGDDAIVLDSDAQGSGDDGFDLGDRARVTRLLAVGNGGTGIALDDYAQVRDSMAMENEGSGITFGISSNVEGCTAQINGSAGLRGSGRIVGNVARRNGQGACTALPCRTCAGIQGQGGGALIEANHTSENGGSGISVFGFGYRIDGNHSSQNAKAESVCAEIEATNTSSSLPNLIIRNSVFPTSGNATAINASANDIVGPTLAGKADTTEPFANFTD